MECFCFTGVSFSASWMGLVSLVLGRLIFLFFFFPFRLFDSVRLMVLNGPHLSVSFFQKDWTRLRFSILSWLWPGVRNSFVFPFLFEDFHLDWVLDQSFYVLKCCWIKWRTEESRTGDWLLLQSGSSKIAGNLGAVLGWAWWSEIPA